MKKTCMFFVTFFAIIHQLNAQGSWKYFNKEDGLVNKDLKVYDVFNDKLNRLWLVTDQCVYIYNDTTWISYTDKNGLIGNKISTSFIDSKGNIWIGSYNKERGDGGVSMFDGNVWKSFRKSEKIFNTAHVRTIFEDSKGRLWMGASTQSSAIPANPGSKIPHVILEVEIVKAIAIDGGLSMYDNGKWLNFNETDQKPPYKTYKTIIEDSKGKIWFFTSKHQLYMYDENKFVVPGRDMGYTSSDIYDVIKDHNGNLWVGSWDRQVKFDGDKWTVYGKKDGVIKSWAHFWTFKVQESKKGFILFSGAQGIIVYDNNTWKNIRYDHVGPYTQHDLDTYNSMEDSEGNIWVYYNNNFGCYNGEKWKQEIKKVDSKFFIDSKSRVWLPEKKGLEMKQGDNWTKKEEYQDIFGFVEDKKGNIWAGMKNKGIMLYDNKDFKLIDTSKGLPSLAISNIFVDPVGRVWFSSDKGLCYYKPE